MIKNKIKSFISKNGGESNKKKIENLVAFLIILIITVIVINVIWSNDNGTTKETEPSNDKNKKLASEVQEIQSDTEIENISNELEKILSHVKGVGKVKVMVTYSRTSQTIPLYNQDSSEKSTEENDKQGGTRKITETDTKTEIIYKEENGEKIPIIQSTISPTIEGAIVTAEGANNAEVKTNIIQAVEAVTGVATHKIQVFEMNTN